MPPHDLSAHAHAHGPGHHHHHHDASEIGDRPLLFAIGLNVVLTGVEVVVGVVSGSLALVADAIHNLGDAAALVVAFVARRIARRGADDRYTFGYRRAELIGALINLTTLVVLGVYLVVEAVERFFVPQPVATTPVMITAGVAVLVDVFTALFLWGLSRGSVNVRAAFVHNLTDAATSVAVILGAALIAATGVVAIDALLTLLIAGGVLWSAVGMLRRTAHILMEGTPPGLDLDRLAARVAEVDDVLRVHHLHAWQLDETHRAVEAHVVVDEGLTGGRLDGARHAIRRVLREEFAVSHATLEFEWPETVCGDDGAHPAPECR